MPLQVHPRWGRPSSNELYTEFYGREEALTRRSRFEDIQIPVKAAIERISKARLNQINHGVTLSDLQSILICSRSAASYSLYASRPLIKGCIYLMNSMKVAGKTSPFSYEFGYLCLRIMTTAFGACLLNNQGQLESAIRSMIANEQSIMDVSSTHISSIIEDAITHGRGRGRETYNCIIGWSHCQDHLKIEDVISIADAGLLLALLWGDRELFFQVMASAVSPGLCGLMYVLWRYIIYQRHCRQLSGSDANRLMVHYTDILWRAHLSTALDQSEVFYLLHSLNGQGFKLWEANPQCINLEDSKFAVRILGHQLLRLTGAIAPANIPSALGYVYQHLIRVIGCEDELATLFSGVLKHLWDLFIDSEDKGVTVDIICEIFGWLSKILVNFAPRCFDHSSMFHIVHFLAYDQIHLLDFIAKIMFSPNPALAGTSPDDLSRYRKFLHASDQLCKDLSRIVPKDNLLQCFWPYYLDWTKYFRHLKFLELLAIGSTDSENYYRACVETWFSIWESLGKFPKTGMVACLDWVSNETSSEVCNHPPSSFFADWDAAAGYGFLS